MGRCFSRGCVWALIVGGAVVDGSVSAQFRVVLPADEESTAVRPAVVSPPRGLSVAFDDAQAKLQAGDSASAIKLLQFVLDHPEDYFTDKHCQLSLKRAVYDILGGMSAEARADYEVLYGPAAEALRRRAELDGDESAERELFARYWMTAAAQRAAAQRARAALDGGLPLAAGRLWDSVSASEIYRQSPQAPVQHVLAWLRADRPDRAQAVWEREPLAAGAVLPFGPRQLEPPADPAENGSWLLQAVPELRPGMKFGRSLWSAFRGDAEHNASAQTAGPIGGVVWTASLFAGYAAWSQAEYGSAGDPREFGDLVENVTQALQTENKLMQPGAHPLVIGDTVVARTPFSLEAYDLRTGKLRWRSVLRNTALAEVLAVPSAPVDEEVDSRFSDLAQDYLRELLFRHQTAGLLSSNGELVYAIEQSPYVERSERYLAALQTDNDQPKVANRLVAYDLAGGRVVWELGGSRRDVVSPFAGAYFLGPPTCIGERMYCLAELGNELRLLQFRETGRPAGPVLEWSQVIAAPQVLLVYGQMRRLSGTVLAAADELLICSTTAGLAVAVDPVRRMLVWGYEYPSLEAANRVDPRLARFSARPPWNEIDEDEGRWLDSAPTVAAGRVLLTPRDSSELHCLDAVTGELLWKRPRDRSLYVAGVRDHRVLLVDRDQVEALDLITGQPAWTESLVTAEPSGRGLFVGRQYLLPLSSGEILAFDHDSGRVRVRARLNAGRIPGNLAAGDGALVSQSLGEICAYRRLPDIERQVETALQQQPNDPDALALRGELRLHEGDDAAAIADLRKSLSIKPNAQASLVLAELLIAGLRTDLPSDRELITEIEGLIQDDHQRTEFLCLTAAAFEKRGELLPAFEQYLKLATPSNAKHPLTRVSRQLTARRDRLIRGHLWGLYAVASPADKEAINHRLQARLQATGDAGRTDEQRYLDYFDGLPYADQARRQMLKRTSTGTGPEQLADWYRLTNSADAQISGSAVARLAQLSIARGAADEAAAWLDRLQQSYAQVEVFDGETGEAVSRKWNGEFQSVLGSARSSWPAVPFEIDRWRQNPVFRRVSMIEQVGPLHPIYRDWTFQFVEEDSQAVVARNAAGRLQWFLPLPETMFDARRSRFSSTNAVPQLHSAGPYFALTFGTSFVVFDVATPDGSPRYLWHRALEHSTDNPFQQSSTTVRPEFMKSGRRRVRAVEIDADMQFGQLIGVTCDQVSFQIADRVIAADPRTGNHLWIRHDVPQQTETTADERHVTILDTISQEALVLRAADGDIVARRAIPDPHDWIWFRGAKLLTLTRPGDELVLQLLDLATGTVNWKTSLSTSSRCAVIDDDTVVCLDQDGNLRILDLAGGHEQWSSSAPRIPELEFLWVQRDSKGLLILAGSHSPRGRDWTLRGYDGNQVPISGVLFRVDNLKKQPAWEIDIEPTAFHVIQPASVPLLIFASRKVPVVNLFGDANAPPSRLSTLFVDRRNGEIVYQTDEAPAPGILTVDVDGDHGVISANFLSFAIDFRLPSEPEDADTN